MFMVKNGAVKLLANDFRPNGIAFSTDEKILYVNGGGVIRRYDGRSGGRVEKGRVFIDMNSDEAPEDIKTKGAGPEGWRSDDHGSVTLWVYVNRRVVGGRATGPYRV